jgi:hypothetical protein
MPAGRKLVTDIIIQKGRHAVVTLGADVRDLFVCPTWRRRINVYGWK